MTCFNDKLNTKHGFDKIYKTMLFHNCSFVDALLIIINNRNIITSNCINSISVIQNENRMVIKAIESLLRGGFHK